MPLDELINELAEEAYADLLKDPGLDPNDPDNEPEVKRKLQYWFMKLVIKGGSLK